MNLNMAIAALMGGLCLPTSGQLALLPGQSWTYTFPSNSAFPQIETLPFSFSPPQQTVHFAVDPGSFGPDTQLRYEIVSGGKYLDQTANWTIWPVASGVLTSVPPRNVSLSYSGVAWLDITSPGGIRFTLLSGSVTITNLALDGLFPQPGPGGSRSTSHRYLTFSPQSSPPLEIVRLGPDRLQVRWPASAVGYTLEVATNVTAGPWSWEPVVDGLAMEGDQLAFEFAVGSNTTPKFFRLHRR